MSFLDRLRARRRGKEPHPIIGIQIGLVAGGAAIADAAQGNDANPDYGWSGDHMSGGSDFGGSGFDAGGGGV